MEGAKFSDEDIKALTHRIQFGGDEVVQAKDGAGSATLSMVSFCLSPVRLGFSRFENVFLQTARLKFQEFFDVQSCISANVLDLDHPADWQDTFNSFIAR